MTLLNMIYTLNGITFSGKKDVNIDLKDQYAIYTYK